MLESQILISVIIPVYNGEKWVIRALDSVLKQKHADVIECIVVDDGSADNSYKIVKEYEKQYNAIKLIRQKNMGEGVARNTGLDYARGKYIAFLDCDDWWEKEFVDDDLLDRLLHEEADIYEFSFKHVTDNYNWEKIYSVDNKKTVYHENRLDNYNYSSLWKHLFKSAIISHNNIRFGRSKTAEDLFFAEQCFFFARLVVSINRVMYVYYKNPNSVMHAANSKTYFDSFILHDERYLWFKKHGVDLYDDCDYQRILLLRRLLIALCKENSFKNTVSIVKSDVRFNLLERTDDFSFPIDKGKEILLWEKHPFFFWLKCKIIYKQRDKISCISRRIPLLANIVDGVIYSRRGYSLIQKNIKGI